jgi:hypothetical protein
MVPELGAVLGRRDILYCIGSDHAPALCLPLLGEHGSLVGTFSPFDPILMIIAGWSG